MPGSSHAPTKPQKYHAVSGLRRSETAGGYFTWPAKTFIPYVRGLRFAPRPGYVRGAPTGAKEVEPDAGGGAGVVKRREPRISRRDADEDSGFGFRA